MISRFALIGLSTLGAAVLSVPPQSRPDGVSITFIANEGVMLSDGRHKVVIDALFERYESFPIAHDTIQRALASARAPFDSLDLILVTHHHGDHFHPAPVVSHLMANPRSRLVASSHVIDSLRSRVTRGAPVNSRILSRTTPPGQRRREVINGIPVEILGIAHGGRRPSEVEHLGFIVDIGGRRVLHIGDVGGSEADFAPLRLDTARIDVALVPMWMVTEPSGRATIDKWIRPRQTVAIHLAEGAPERQMRVATAAMPGTTAFLRSMETRRW